jgi:hypothetical protein
VTAQQYAAPKRLGVNVFTAPGKPVVGERPRPFGEPLGWDPITSTLIYGEYDAVLVDTLATVAEAEALLAALHPRIAVAGHKKTGAPDLPSAIRDSKRYLEDFDRLQQNTQTDEELFNEMTVRYPDWESNQSWLMFGFPSFPSPTED